ncbi:MAG: SHOCT domain-containing protein [Desulfosporosinus sp.]|nr:SHOCT domain-containing protein [Desulfosporosinus sp.]
MMWGYGTLYGNGSWWIGLVMMAVHILFWGFIIWFGVSLFNRSGGRSKLTNGGNEAMEILRERYAKGEIDTVEFNRRKEVLAK